MRRILLGGLGIALGVFCRPAFAQQPATHGTQLPTRAATLGKPIAVSPVPVESEITQTGLLRFGPARPTVTNAPSNIGTPTPIISQPPSGSVPMVQPKRPTETLPPPRTEPGAKPNVTESREPKTVTPGRAIAPSVVPEGYSYPISEMEAPQYDSRPRNRALELLSGGFGTAWVSAEMLTWWNRSSQVPALVTTSTPQFNGILGQGDTRTILGGSFGDTFNAGMRIGGGIWFNDNECRGLDWRFFFVSPNTASFTASTPPNALLARPFFNVNPGINLPNVSVGQSSEVVAGPGVANGSVTAVTRSSIWGAEANYRRWLACNPCSRLDLLVGYRHLDLNDRLTITERFNRIPGSDMTIGTPAQSGIITDSFRTENQFHGGQIGLAGTVRRGRWSLDPRATVAFGSVQQEVEISGAQQLTFANGTTTTTPGGLLAVPGANIGTFSRDRFAVVPEVGLNVGWNATERLKFTLGYNFLYLSSVVRPADAIDTRLDAARVPNLLPPGAGTPLANPIRPQPQFNSNGYYIQGINFGLAYKW